MATLREIKRRIRSINNTAKVTHAMELVAATKIRKSQEKALLARPYTDTLHQILRELSTKAGEKAHELLVKNNVKAQMAILVSTDRGLVGGLNLNVFRETLKLEVENLKYVVVGKKGLSFAARHAEVIASFHTEEQPFLDLARTLTKLAIDAFRTGAVGAVYVISPKFISTIKQVPTITKILPIELKVEQPTIPPSASLTDPLFKAELSLFEPASDLILERILPHHILTLIYQTLLEAKASEHSARMVAMKNATDAASDLVDDLTLTYNQVRQEAITKELLDIVTAQSTFE